MRAVARRAGPQSCAMVSVGLPLLAFGEPTSYLAPLRFPALRGFFVRRARTENCSLVGLQPGWVTVCFNAVPCCAFPARIPALCNRFCGNVGVGCRVAAHMADLAPLRRGFFVLSCRVSTQKPTVRLGVGVAGLPPPRQAHNDGSTKLSSAVGGAFFCPCRISDIETNSSAGRLVGGLPPMSVLLRFSAGFFCGPGCAKMQRACRSLSETVGRHHVSGGSWPASLPSPLSVVLRGSQTRPASGRSSLHRRGRADGFLGAARSRRGRPR